jgi:hypothetical protein
MKEEARAVVSSISVRMTVGVTFLAMTMGMGIAAWAQSVEGVPGCGQDSEHFDVKTSKKQAPETKAVASQAAVYFVQDDREFQSTPKPVMRVGIDGKWVGATHGNSYVMAVVEAGERHLCTNWQASVGIGMPKQSGALHFTAEAGKSYYFVAKNRWFREKGLIPMKLEALDSDQGQLLVSQFAYAEAKPK